jgi:nucleotide-binding universal stress UspA family protein
MKKISRILFPTDYSPFSNETIEYAIAFALEYGARLYIMHVIELATNDPKDPLYKKPNLSDYTDVHNFVKSSTARQLKGARLASSKFEFKEIHSMGLSASREIVKAAKAKKVDIIVMASLGAGFLKKLLLGSTTEHVIRDAVCPVIVTNKGARNFVNFETDSIKIGRIVCPVDFSACSARAVKAAIDFAERFGAEIILLHILDDGSQINDFYLKHFKPADLKKMEKTAKIRLENFASKNIGKGIKHTSVVVTGNPKKDISIYTSQKKADIIIISAFGTGEKDNCGFSGSVLLKVVKSADCPVLIVR